MNMGRDVTALREEREAILISLGKVMHKIIRDGGLTDNECLRMSERIAQIDAEISKAEGGSIPIQGGGICPRCGSLLTTVTAQFCGKCGTNIAQYYAWNTTLCEKCGQITSTDGEYCIVCGARCVKQGESAYGR